MASVTIFLLLICTAAFTVSEEMHPSESLSDLKSDQLQTQTEVPQSDHNHGGISPAVLKSLYG